MEEKILNLLNYIKSKNALPSSEDLGVSPEIFKKIIKKCINDGLLDKKYIYVNILGDIECDEDAELALTTEAYRFMENHNELGKVKTNM